MTVDEAREAARKVLAKAELGEDVAEQKAKERAEKTMADLCDLYVAEGCELKKASTLKSDRGRIERHIKPLLGTKRIGKITSADIEKFMRDVANGKTAVDVKTGKHGRAIVTGGKGTATRTVRLLGGIFSFAIRQRMLKTNPAHGIAKFADKRNERFLSTEELIRLGASIRLAETDGLPWEVNENHPKAKHVAKEKRATTMSPHVAGAMRLLLFTVPVARNPRSEVGACRFRARLAALAGQQDRTKDRGAECSRACCAERSASRRPLRHRR